MPKIYQYIGFIFFFYSNEHDPIHCHIKKGQREVKAEMEYVDGKLIVTFKKLRGKVIFRGDDLDEIEYFIRKKHLQIVEKWTSFFIFGKSPIFEKIKEKR